MKLEYIVDCKCQIKEYIRLKISRKFMRHLKFLNVKYYINDKNAQSHFELIPGDKLTIIYDEEMTKDNHLYEYDIDVLYETDDYMIINKPSGLKSIPTGYNDFKSLYNAVLYYYKKHNINATIHLINRLDKDTEGLLVVAKNKLTANLLSKNLDNINRYYLALVEGIVDSDGYVDKPITRSNEGIKRKVSDDGKNSKTLYKVLKKYDNQTLLELHLLTGRCHQIRVHMSYINHPIVGDEIYGNGDLLHLTSYKIEMKDPYTGKDINIKINPTWIKEE